MESGSAWKTTQHLGHIVPKKSTLVIRLTDISLICAKLNVKNWF